MFLVTWMPTYLIEMYPDELDEIFGDSRADRTILRPSLAGVLTAITGLAGVAGNLCGGWLGDRAVARFGLRWGRRATGLVSSVLAALDLSGRVVHRQPMVIRGRDDRHLVLVRPGTRLAVGDVSGHRPRQHGRRAWLCQHVRQSRRGAATVG